MTTADTSTGPRPDRIRVRHEVTAMVAPDTVALLARRITNLLRHGRRMAMTERMVHPGGYDGGPAELWTGLTCDGQPRVWRSRIAAGFEVRLKPGLLRGFGFTANPLCDVDEAHAWRRYDHGDEQHQRRNMTHVAVTGGIDGRPAGRTDGLTIRSWNESGVCVEKVIAFDHDTGPHAGLAAIRDELHDHMAVLNSRQPWENRDMLTRVLAALDTHTAVAGGGTTGDRT